MQTLFSLSSRAFFGAALALFLPLAGQAGPDKPGRKPAPQSILKVNATNQPYSFSRPWTKETPYSRKGIGVVIEGGRVLVTAEMVANNTFVELEVAGNSRKSTAKILAVDYDANLALLEPDDADFLSDFKPVPLDKTARVGDTAEILQLEGNGQVAQTPATLTTIAVNEYPLDGMALLVFRLSAPLQNRDGSFVLPAFRNQSLLGLVMRYDSRSQTADVIPAPVIARFLENAKGPEYKAFPRAGITFSNTRDPQLRKYLGLTEPGGIYVTEVLPETPAEKAGLKKGDVLLAISGKAIDQDGLYDDPKYGKISLSNLISIGLTPGTPATFSILRDGQKQDLEVALAPLDRSKIVSESYIIDKAPRYVILGGLVFQELSRTYLKEWGGGWMKDAPQRLVYLDAFQSELPRDQGKIVFLSQVLPSEDTLGYQSLAHLVVKSVNGVPIHNLEDLARAAETPVDGFQKIEFEEDPGVIYLDAVEIEKNKDRLMEDYGLPSLKNL